MASGTERHLASDAIIVSKTDTKGRIVYANETFLDIAGYTEAEVLGKPHNIVRHPDMPRAVFKLLWDTLSRGEEIFAYVVNLTKDGGFYWVFAHVTPTLDAEGKVLGFHSNRRAPRREAVESIRPIYRDLLDEEARHANPKEAAQAGLHLLQTKYLKNGGTYENLVFSL